MFLKYGNNESSSRNSVEPGGDQVYDKKADGINSILAKRLPYDECGHECVEHNCAGPGSFPKNLAFGARQLVRHDSSLRAKVGLPREFASTGLRGRQRVFDRLNLIWVMPAQGGR